MMLRGLLLLIGTLTLTPVLAAETDTVTVTATGYGATPTEATTRALVEASRQALGGTVVLDPRFRSAMHEWVIRESGNGSLATGHWSSAPEVQAPVMASLEGYRVLETGKVEEGLWRSRVEARVLEYEGFTADKQQLPTLVVAPFRTTQSHYDLGARQPAQRVERRFRQYLENALQGSGDIRLLDRSFTAAAEREGNIAAANLSPEQQAKRGQALGADLLLAGEIEQFALGESNKEFYGVAFNTLQPRVIIHYRLMDTATGEILKADTLDYRKLPESLRKAFQAEDIDPEREPERIGEVFYPRVATTLADAVLQTLYPIQVLAAAGDGRFYISAGEGRVRPGDLFSAHAVAGRTRDPETGLPIRMETEALATLRVTSVHDGYAVVETLGEPASKLGTETVLRRQARVEEEPQEDDTPTTPGSSEQPLDWGQ